MVHDGTMPLAKAGRPRLNNQRRPGMTARDEILDAAGELFTTLGYAGTTTRTIAESVGIRQASLYHYFKTKDDILCALLEPFWSDRERLRLHYLSVSKAIVADTGVDEAAADLPFRLVESLVNVWTTPPGPERTQLPEHVADACLRVLGAPVG